MATSKHGKLELESIPSAQNLQIAVVVSAWNIEITESLFDGAYSVLKGKNCKKIHRLDVPGSFELIFGCKLASKAGFDAVIALGSLIRGETSHFEYVCQAVSNGIKDLNVLGSVPVIFGVLTDDNFDQAKARSGGLLGNKGAEAAATAIKMASLTI
jgi:6,7-dimethyl-8-ribityllumazine synthase